MSNKNVLAMAPEEILPRKFVRGQDFRFKMELPVNIKEGAFAGWTPTCQLRRRDNVGPAGLIADITVTWADPATCIELWFDFPGDTSQWPLGPAEFDVVFTKQEGERTRKARTLPVQIEIDNGVTQ